MASRAHASIGSAINEPLITVAVYRIDMLEYPASLFNQQIIDAGDMHRDHGADRIGAVNSPTR